jgi:hypothetical protein
MRLGGVSDSNLSTSESHHYMYVEVTHCQCMNKRVTVCIFTYLSPLYAQVYGPECRKYTDLGFTSSQPALMDVESAQTW